MSYFCCTSNILKSVIDISNVYMNIDVSMNVIDISNIQIYLDMSNNERIVSVPVFTIDPEIISNTITETTNLLADAKDIFIDISNNPQHILNIKEEFLAVDLTEPLLEINKK